MRRIVSLLVTVVMLLTMIPVVAQAAQVDGEDVILNYGANGGAVEVQANPCVWRWMQGMICSNLHT